MKNLYKAFASAAVALLAVSCVNEMANDTPDGLFRKYNLSFDDGTKTELSGSGSTRQVKWNEGDEIKYYTKDKQSSVSTASVALAGSTAFVEIPRGRSDDFINAVYGAGSLTASSSTADYMYVTSPAKIAQSYTSFAQAHLCAAFSSDLEDPDLKFHNAVSILKFTSAASISKVVFSGNKGEVITGGSNGDLKITYSGGAVSAEPSSTGGSSVTVTTGGQESDFYIAILPVNFSEGIIVRGYDASGYLLCERKTSGDLNTVNAAGLPIIANLGSLQEWLDNPKPTAVDLGLSVKWASFNLGASTPEGSGDYFSWGETAPKSSYTWSTYAYGQGKNGPFSEYVTDAAHGTPDYKTVLDLEDDAAHAVWGDAWRMPSKEEFQELRNNCTWTWTTLGGVNGYKITSKKSGYTGNFIFLPAAGMMSGSKVQNAGTEGDYWSSSLYTTEPCSSWSPYFTSSEFSTGDCYRYFGLPVRAVCGEVVPVTKIELNTTSIALQPGESSQLIANILPGNAINNSLIWVSSDDSVATVDSQGLVTAVSLGTANISVYSANGVFAACRVSVIQHVTGIELDKYYIEGAYPLIIELSAIITPDNATDKSVIWSSDNEDLEVNQKGVVIVKRPTSWATITATTVDGGLQAQCFVSVYPPSSEAVDLNLSVKWATCNIGAIHPEQYGCYFAWGETEPKWCYDWATYRFGSDSNGPFSKYVLNPSYGIVDERSVLDPEDDAATVYLGEGWRMPTEAEWKELKKNCTWTLTTENDIPGYRVTRRGESIFLPAAGDRYKLSLGGVGELAHYWSSSLNKYSCGQGLCFQYYYDDSISPEILDCWRCGGLSIRPVKDYTAEERPVFSVSLDKSMLILPEGKSHTLTAKVEPSNAVNKSVFWHSDDEGVATVDQKGVVTAIKSGTTTITVISEDGGHVACCSVLVTEIGNDPFAVDLGLPSGLKWATVNVGATKPEDYGDYFAWGETEPYYSSQTRTWKDGKTSGYDWPSYKWYNESYDTLTKYNTNSSYGTVDNKTILDLDDDAAHMNWGGSWRMPTYDEWTELMTKCTWTWSTTQNGVNGRLVTGPNGKSIFLPAAGDWRDTVLYGAGSRGYYWSSSLSDGPFSARSVGFFSNYVGSYIDYRYYGFSVRPVSE